MPEADAKARASNKTTPKKKMHQDAILGITNSSIERLMHQAGIKTVSGSVYTEVRGILREKLEHAVEHILQLMYSDRRKTVMPEDVLDYFESLTKVYPTGFEDQISRCKTYEQARAQSHTSAEKRKKPKDGDAQKASRRKPRYPQALRKIRFYQKQHDCVLFPKLAFYKLVQEYTQYYEKDVRWSADAMGLLQIVMETHLREFFKDVQLSAIHAKRVRIEPKDLNLTLHMHHSSM